MKKILLSLALVVMLTVPMIGVMAQDPVDPSAEMRQGCTLIRNIEFAGTPYSEGDQVSYGAGEGAGAIVCLLNTVYRITGLIFTIIMVLVMLLVLYGGFLILTGGQSEDNVAKGKKFITYAMAGLAVALLAWVAPFIVTFLIQ